MPFISVTRLRVRSWRFFPAFILDAVRSARQAKAAQGNLGARVLRDVRNTWWTCTCWDSEASMRKFMLATPHRTAMLKLRVWCDEAAIVHWTQPSPALPSWLEAHRRLQQEGRPSRVDHPSRDHTAKVIAKPAVSGNRESVFK